MRAIAEEQPAAYHGQYAGIMKMFCRDIHQIGRDKGDGGVDAGAPQEELSGEDRGQRKPEDDKAGGVIDEAFAFEDRHGPFGYPEILKDAGCGYGIGRGDDATQQETQRQGKIGDKPVGKPGHRQRREENETESKQAENDQ